MPALLRSDYATVAGIVMATPQIMATDISEWLDGPEVRGSDLTIPHRVGVVPRPRTVAVRRIDTPFVIRAKDPDGGAVANGLLVNLALIKAAWHPAAAAADGTVACSLTLPTGTKSGRCTIDPRIQVVRYPAHIRGILSVTLPAGVLT